MFGWASSNCEAFVMSDRGGLCKRFTSMHAYVQGHASDMSNGMYGLRDARGGVSRSLDFLDRTSAARDLLVVCWGLQIASPLPISSKGGRAKFGCS